MTSTVGRAHVLQLEIQIPLIGSGLKESCDQLTTFAMGMKEESGIRYAFQKPVRSFLAPYLQFGSLPPERQALLG